MGRFGVYRVYIVFQPNEDYEDLDVDFDEEDTPRVYTETVSPRIADEIHQYIYWRLSLLNIGIERNVLDNDLETFVRTCWSLPIYDIQRIVDNFDITHPSYEDKVSADLRNWFRAHNVEFHFNIIGQNYQIDTTCNFLDILDEFFDLEQADIISISGDIAVNYTADKRYYHWESEPLTTTLVLPQSAVEPLLRVPNAIYRKPVFFNKLFNKTFSNFQMKLDNQHLPIAFHNVLQKPQYSDMLDILEFNRVQGYHTVAHLYRRNKFEEPFFKAPFSQAMVNENKIDEALEMKDLKKLRQSVHEVKTKYGGGSYRFEIGFTFKPGADDQHVSTDEIRENLGKIHDLCRDISIEFVRHTIAVPSYHFTDAIYLFSKMICNAITPILLHYKKVRIVSVETKNLVAALESVMQANLNGDLRRYFGKTVQNGFTLRNDWIWINSAGLKHTMLGGIKIFYLESTNPYFCSRKVCLKVPPASWFTMDTISFFNNLHPPLQNKHMIIQT